MNKILLDIIDLDVYKKLADEVVIKIVDGEIERAKMNLQKRRESGDKLGSQQLISQTKQNILTISIVTTNSILNKVLNIIQEADASLAKDFLGVKDDFSGQP